MAHHNQAPWDEALLAKLRSEPYASMPQGDLVDDGDDLDRADDAIADLLNAETVDLPVRYVDIQTSAILNYLALAGTWGALKAGARNGDPEADTFVDLIMLGGSIGAANREQLIKLVNALPIYLNSDQRDAIVELGIVRQSVPFWQSIGATSPFNRHDLIRARWLTEMARNSLDVGKVDADAS